MTELCVDTLAVKIGRTQILQEVSFQASPGKVLAIIGPNGSGKSTLLRAMTGELPYSGSVRLGHLSVKDTPPADLARHRAVLPQHATVSFPLMVSEVLRLGQTIRTMSPAARDLQLIEALALVDLAGYQSRFYHTLSGGEQQRVQLARVLCQIWDPVQEDGPAKAGANWLFLDEPVSSLDIRHQVQIMKVARSYAQRGGGVVTIMHDLNLTAHFADDVLILKNGRMLAQGPAQNVLTKQTLTAAFDFPVAITETQSARPQIFPELGLAAST